MYLTTIQIDGQTKSNSTATCNANIARQSSLQNESCRYMSNTSPGHHKLAGTFFVKQNILLWKKKQTIDAHQSTPKKQIKYVIICIYMLHMYIYILYVSCYIVS